MKHFTTLFLIIFVNFAFALVQSDQEAKQFFKEQGAGHGDFIEAVDTLIIDSTQIIPKGSHCISLPIKATVKKHHISYFSGVESDSTKAPDIIIVWAKYLPLCAVRIKQTLYIGRSFKEIANELLKLKIH